MGTHPIFEADFDCLTEMVEVPIDEILDQVTLQRWLISIVIGPVFGLIGLKGILGLALYGCAIALISLAIVNRHGKDALERVGGSTLVIKEGGLSAFAAFCVTWIITFTAMH